MYSITFEARSHFVYAIVVIECRSLFRINLSQVNELVVLVGAMALFLWFGPLGTVLHLNIE
jgi:hypothetical protein